MRIAGYDVPPIVVAGAAILAAAPIYYTLQATAAAAKAAAAAANAAAEGIVATTEALNTDGTPYKGYGVVGAVANVEDKAAGGLLSKFGGWLGRTVYDVTHPPSSSSSTSSASSSGQNVYDTAGGY